jgi:hypothetical protein
MIAPYFDRDGNPRPRQPIPTAGGYCSGIRSIELWQVIPGKGKTATIFSPVYS